MESPQRGSSELNHHKSKKSKASRRVWTRKEEETLVTAMKDLVTQGWKTDNGFRAGYLNRLEDTFKKQLPGTNLRGNPHINSKLTTWKKYFYSLSTLLSQRGVKFNLEGTFTLNCDEALWDSIVKNDTNANKIRSKSWPFYYDWKEIFGKDRPTGEGAEDILDAVNDVGRECAIIEDDDTPGDNHVMLDHPGDNNVNLDHPGDNNVNLDHVLTPDNGDNNSVCQSQQPDRVSKCKGKKRKTSDDGIEKLCALLEEISRNTNTRLEALASRIGYEYDLGKARMGIYEKLGNIPDLSINGRFTVCEILGSRVGKLEIFMGLPESARADYVRHLLKSI